MNGTRPCVRFGLREVEAAAASVRRGLSLRPKFLISRVSANRKKLKTWSVERDVSETIATNSICRLA